MYNASHGHPANYHGAPLMFQEDGRMRFHTGGAPAPDHGYPGHLGEAAAFWEQHPHSFAGRPPGSHQAFPEPRSLSQSLPVHHAEIHHLKSLAPAPSHNTDPSHLKPLPPITMPVDHHSQAGNVHGQPPVVHHHPAYAPVEGEYELGPAAHHPLDQQVHEDLGADRSSSQAASSSQGVRPRPLAHSVSKSETVISAVGSEVVCCSGPSDNARDPSRHYWFKSHPDGNLYRGWAIGLQSGLRQRILTLCVMFVQIVGPVLMCQWAWRLLSEQGGPVSLYNQWKEHGFNNEDLELKLMGTVLLILIYFNADNVLSNKDCQTIRLVQMYESKLNMGWIFIDALCNSWVIAVSAPAVPALLWCADSIKDLVMDAFGLLFLVNLDNYDGDITFGVDIQDFDDDVEKKEELIDKHLPIACLKPNVSCWEFWCHHLQTGHFLYGVARMFNLVTGCFAVPAFSTLCWSKRSNDKHWFTHGVFNWTVTLTGLFLLVAMYGVRFYIYWQHRPRRGPLDCSSWIVKFCLRGHDPRGTGHVPSNSSRYRELSFTRALSF